MSVVKNGCQKIRDNIPDKALDDNKEYPVCILYKNIRQWLEVPKGYKKRRYIRKVRKKSSLKEERERPEDIFEIDIAGREREPSDN